MYASCDSRGSSSVPFHLVLHLQQPEGGMGLPGTGVGLWYSHSCLKALFLPSVASLMLSAAASGFWLVPQGFGQVPALLTLFVGTI